MTKNQKKALLDLLKNKDSVIDENNELGTYRDGYNDALAAVLNILI